MSKHVAELSEDRHIEATKLKNEYIESLKDQIQMLQEQIKSSQTQHEVAQNRLMSMFEQTQRLMEGC
jgi:uncharacterized protein YnzC (UPF0291/DUF896 family)